VQQFYQCLLARGYTRSHLLPLFEKYITKYTTAPNPAPATAPGPPTIAPEPDANNTVFLHIPFHPLDPPSTEIQKLFRKHLLKERGINPYGPTPLYKIWNDKGKELGIRRMIVAYHRPKNIGNFLAPRRIDRLPGPSASALLPG